MLGPLSHRRTFFLKHKDSRAMPTSVSGAMRRDALALGGSARQASQFPSQQDEILPFCNELLVSPFLTVTSFTPIFNLIARTPFILVVALWNYPRGLSQLPLVSPWPILLPQTRRHRLGLTAGTQGAKTLHLNHFGMPSFPLLRAPKGPNAVAEEPRPLFFPFFAFLFPFLP